LQAKEWVPQAFRKKICGDEWAMVPWLRDNAEAKLLAT